MNCSWSYADAQRRAKKGLISEQQLASFVELIGKSKDKLAQFGAQAIVLESARLVAHTTARDFEEVHDQFYWAMQKYNGPVTIVDYADGSFSVGREPGEFFRTEQYAGFAQLTFRIRRQLSMIELKLIKPARINAERSCVTKHGRVVLVVDISRL